MTRWVVERAGEVVLATEMREMAFECLRSHYRDLRAIDQETGDIWVYRPRGGFRKLAKPTDAPRRQDSPA